MDLWHAGVRSCACVDACVYLLSLRARMTHASVSAEERQVLGISDTLVCTSTVYEYSIGECVLRELYS